MNFLGRRESTSSFFVYPAGPDLDQVLGNGFVPVQFPSCVQQALNAGYEEVPEHCSVTRAAILP